MASANNETYVKLEVHNDEYSSKNPQTLFVKGTWYATHFSLSVLDGCNTWILHASEELVAIAAGEWGMEVKEYLEQLQMQFSVQNPDSRFSFTPVSDKITLASASYRSSAIPVSLCVQYLSMMHMIVCFLQSHVLSSAV
jgi:hypothetical protein